MNRDIASEVCVIGGGPAGLAASIALARRGHEVTTIDCAIPPIDKACGEGLTPDSVAALGRLGVNLPRDAGFGFRGISFIGSGSATSGDFPDATGFGLRRIVLHRILIEHAERLGVRLIWGAKNVHLADGSVTSGRHRIRARLMVGADGQKSLVRKQAGLDAVRSEKRRYGFRRHYLLVPWSQYIEVYWGSRFQIYVTPVAPDQVCVALISADSRLRLDEALRELPELEQRLAPSRHASPEMGALSLSRRFHQVQRENIALVGDASGSVDAITGEGMCLAFKQAEALAEAVQANDLRAYEKRHRELSKRPHQIASLMLSLERSHKVQRKALAALAKRPQIFESLLAVHVSEASFRDLFSWGLLDFGLRFLTA